MMKQYRNTLLLIVLVFSIIGCERNPSWIDIKFINNTDFTLLCLDAYRELSDTVLQEENPWPQGPNETSGLIKPHSTHVSRVTKFGLTHLEEHGLCLTLYFFDVDIIKTVPWEKIRTDNIVIKAVDIHSLDEIENKYKKIITVP